MRKQTKTLFNELFDQDNKSQESTNNDDQKSETEKTIEELLGTAEKLSDNEEIFKPLRKLSKAQSYDLKNQYAQRIKEIEHIIYKNAIEQTKDYCFLALKKGNIKATTKFLTDIKLYADKISLDVTDYVEEVEKKLYDKKSTFEPALPTNLQ
jgi:hypothetical protein